MIKTNKTRSLKVAMLAGVASFALTNAHAQSADDKAIEFDIDAQELGAALTEFGIQSGKEVYFVEADVNGKTTNGLEGQYTSDRAITLILADAGVPYTFDNNGTVLVGNEYVRDAFLGEETLPQPFRVAQLDEEEDVRGVNRQSDDFENERREDVIVVTGTSIRGVYPESAPLDVYTAGDIAKSGATTLNRFLETLPQNVGSLSPLAASLGPGQGDSNDGGGIDLRGLGVGTTLVLLNGQRLTAPSGRSPDVSLIPVGAIERVEVLTDGASAVYGSDAIAGVVNIILRDEFDGAGFNASYGGVTDGGHDRALVDVYAGKSWESGSGFLSYSRSNQSSLSGAERDFVSDSIPRQSLTPDERTQSVMGAVNQEVSNKLRLFGNALYSTRKAEQIRDRIGSTIESRVETEQIFASAGLEYKILEDLFFRLDATYLEDETQTADDNFTSGRLTEVEDFGDSLDLVAKIDGRLVELPGGESRFSIGGGYSEQTYTFLGRFAIDQFTLNRDSGFVFAEGFFPLIGSEQGINGIDRLEVSAAIRYTDYSDFESAATPRFGVLWSPTKGVNIRGTYARNFRAPTLSEFSPNRSIVSILSPSAFGLPDPFSPDNSSVLLTVNGPGRSGLTAEFSDTFTAGFDIEPATIDNLKISATYFNIDYTDRLGIPTGGSFAVLLDPASFASLYNQSPTRDEIVGIVEQVPAGRVFDATGSIPNPDDSQQVADVVTLVLDDRLTNLANSKSEGIDFSVDYRRGTTIGDLSVGARLTYTLESSQQASAGDPVISTVDFVGRPVSLKARAHAGLSHDGFSGQINMNYVDGYTNNTVVPEEPIDDWITFDLNLSYDFTNTNGVLSDTGLFVTVNNLFDVDPPFVAQEAASNSGGLITPVGFDPTNANAVGRFITVGVRKQF